jgi:hypothetical protein
MKKITILFVALLLLGVQIVNAQQRTITGSVTSSEDGGTLPGVSVLVKGTTIGTVTDIDGNYTLSVSADATALVYSYVGMLTKEVVIGSTNVMNVALAPASIGVDEVVITAFGISREKKAIGYSVEDVSGEEFTKAREANVVNSL